MTMDKTYPSAAAAVAAPALSQFKPVEYLPGDSLQTEAQLPLPPHCSVPP